MRTGILSHSYQPCWTIINSPWLPAGQEPVLDLSPTLVAAQVASYLAPQVSWLVEGFEGEGASFTEKSARMSCLVAAQVVLHDHHLLGKGLASLHRKEVLIVDLQNIVNGKEQLLKGFEQ